MIFLFMLPLMLLAIAVAAVPLIALSVRENRGKQVPATVHRLRASERGHPIAA